MLSHHLLRHGLCGDDLLPPQEAIKSQLLLCEAGIYFYDSRTMELWELGKPPGGVLTASKVRDLIEAGWRKGL